MTRTRRTSSIIACCLILGLFSACTITDSDDVSASDVREGFGSSSSPTAGGSTSGGSSSSKTPTPSKRVGDVATASATAPEAPSDALRFGTTPPYAEIISGNIAGRGRTLVFTLAFADDLPRTNSDPATTFSAGYRFQIADVAYVLSAKPTAEGWTLAATKDRKSVASGGTVRAEGATLTITVPWSFLGGPRAFTWTAFLAWNQETPTKSYVVDIVPNNGEAPFPS